MSHERTKRKIFFAENSIPKIGECHAISFYNGILASIIENSLNLLASAEFCTEIEIRKESCTCKSA